jgi:hypothetical protein
MIMPLNGHEWERCDEADPNRCIANTMHGQCGYKARPGMQYCPRHCHVAEVMAGKRAANRYRLLQYQERMTELSSDGEIKNLRAEIGILRMVLEETLIQCDTPAKFACYSGKVSDTIIKIKTLVQACHKLEVAMGHMLDRDKVMLIAQRIVEIVSDFVTDPDKLESLNDRLIGSILEIANAE